MKNFLFVFAGLCFAQAICGQTNTTLSLLTHTVWEHGKPAYGDYRQMVYTDSTIKIWCKDENDRMASDSCRWYYLTDREEMSFDVAKMGKRKDGNYYMMLDYYGNFTCFKILEIGKERLKVVAIRVNGKEKTPGIPWTYTPLRKR